MGEAAAEYGRKIVSFLRIREWFASKVPFLMSGVFCCIAVGLPGARSGLAGAAAGPPGPLAGDRGAGSEAGMSGQLALCVLLLTAFVSLFLQFGYLINDYADLEADHRAGKDKVMYHMPRKLVRLVLTIVAAGGILCALGAGMTVRPSAGGADPARSAGSGTFWMALVFCILVTYLLGASYSMPPFRFKERGVLGLAVSSFAQRCMPLLTAALVLSMDRRVTVFYTALSFIIGLRYIFIHQVIDAENDRRAGVHTFAERHLPSCIRGVFSCFAAEVLLIALLLSGAGSAAAWGLAGADLVLECFELLAVKKVMGQKVFTTFYCVPLEQMENIALPLIFAGLCVMRGRLPVLYLLVCALVLAEPAGRKANLVVVYFRETWRKKI